MVTNKNLTLNQLMVDNKMEDYEIKLAKMRDKQYNFLSATTFFSFLFFFGTLVINHKYIMFGFGSSIILVIISIFIWRAHWRKYHQVLGEFYAFIAKTAPEIKKG